MFSKPALTYFYHSINEIFDPDRVDDFYALGDNERSETLAEHRPTNYSVVRPELLARLYDIMYHQRLRERDSNQWAFQIQGSRELCDATHTKDGKVTLRFTVPKSSNKTEIVDSGFDLVLVATGYTRNEHARLLAPVGQLIEGSFNSVERGYRLKLKQGAVDSDCGIWLQGCCEASHGVSPFRKILSSFGVCLIESLILEIP